MIFNLLAFAFLDEGIAAVFNSPFIIPVAGCVMVACIVVSSVWAGVRSQEIKSHERLAKIAQGIPVEPEWQEAKGRMADAGLAQVPVGGRARPNDGGKARRAGIVLASIGLGLFGFFAALAVIVRVREVLAGGVAGIFPLAIGIGFLVDARLKRQEYERYMEWERLGTGVGVGLPAGSVPPPPPPAGMSAAQASDWRPLH